MASRRGTQALPAFEAHTNAQISNHQTGHSTDRKEYTSEAERGWQKTVIPPGRISPCRLPGHHHQHMAVAVSLQVHTFYLPNQEGQPTQSPQTETYTPDTCLISILTPNLSHVLEDQLSLSA